MNNIYIYWVGYEYKLIKILRNIIYLHSTHGKGYTVNLITKDNILEYVTDLPDNFYNLCPAHQADYVRVHVICDKGGIWLDSDTLVIDTLDSLFDILENKNGFFIKENNTIVWNGIFGSRPNTPLMVRWKQEIKTIVQNKQIGWSDMGCMLLDSLIKKSPEYFKDYEIFNGLDTMYPVNWDTCVNEYINKSYDNYKNIERVYQPLLVLVNSVYKKIDKYTEEEILNGTMPINYFINKSFNNMNYLVDYSFIEIGTSNFDTLIQKSTLESGISVEPIKYYIDCLPSKPNVKKLNIAISDKKSKVNIYYIPESVILEHNLPDWFKGCNTIDDYHPLHKQHKVTHLCKIDKVDVITTYELFYTNKAKSVDFLKIDTEGHDCIILKSLHSYLKYLPKIFYPKKIKFESNEHTLSRTVDEIVKLYCEIGYTISYRGYDTILILKL